MHEQLTIYHSLYLVPEDLLNRYKKIAQTYVLHGYVQTAKSFDPLNNYAVVFNIWCLLHADKEKLYLNLEKQMDYSIDYFILDQLRNDIDIRRFVKVNHLSSEELYIVAFYLACATLKWGDTVIHAYNGGAHLLTENRNRDYFNDSTIEKNQAFQLFQKKIIYLMANNRLYENDWQINIHQGLKEAKDHIYSGRQSLL